MKISFIIPVYNAESTIEACLHSILNQKTDHPFEVIVVDNNSTDKTANLLKKFNIISLFEKERNRSLARNRGAQEARGEYLAFIDADVILSENWLDEMLKDAGENIVGIQGIIEPRPSGLSPFLDGYRFFLYQERKIYQHNILKMLIQESPMINSASCIYRKKEFIAMGGFDPSLRRHEDIDLSKRLFISGNALLCTQAHSYVSYDQGVRSYLMRSFEEGYTKIDYFKKWSGEQYRNIPSSLFFKVVVLIKMILFPLIQGIVTFNLYYCFKALNIFFRLMGNLGAIGRSSQKPLRLERKDSSVFEGSSPIIHYHSLNHSLERVL